MAGWAHNKSGFVVAAWDVMALLTLYLPNLESQSIERQAFPPQLPLPRNALTDVPRDLFPRIIILNKVQLTVKTKNYGADTHLSC